MQSTTAIQQFDASETELVKVDGYTGEGCELFGCYAATSGTLHSGAGSDLFGCYNRQQAGDSANGHGSDLFGCYSA